MRRGMMALGVAGLLVGLGMLSYNHQSARASQGSGCMPTVGVVSGLQFANDVNAGIAALISGNSGSTTPVTDCSGVTVEGQGFYNTTNSQYRPWGVFDGTSVINAFTVDKSNHQLVPPIGGGTPASIASASTVDLGSVPQSTVIITGSTGPITSFGSSASVGQIKVLRFASTPSITYNVTSMILPTGGNSITAAAGDAWAVEYEGSGNWRVIVIQLASGAPVSAEAACFEKDWKGITAPSGYLIEDGSSVLVATYPALAACLTAQIAGGTVNGQVGVTGISSTGSLRAGHAVCGPGIPSGDTIASVTGGSTINLTIAATLTATNTLTFAPWGCTGTTNINVPDMRGRASYAADDQGSNGAASRITTAGSGCTGYLGAACGAQNRTIAQANIPNYSLPVTDPGHSHGFAHNAVTFDVGGLGQVDLSGGTGFNAFISTQTATTGVTVASGGSGSALATLGTSGFGIKVIKF